MLTGLNCSGGGSYAALIDTTAGTLLWDYQVASLVANNLIAGQLSVTEVSGQPVVAFGTQTGPMIALQPGAAPGIVK
jgi:hypothetical protein